MCRNVYLEGSAFCNILTILGLLQVCLAGASVGNNSAVKHGKCRRPGVIPSARDVPPGVYSWSVIPPELAGNIESAGMVVSYGVNLATADFYILDTSHNNEHFITSFFELRPGAYVRGKSKYGLAKCYYFSRPIAKLIRQTFSIQEGKIGEHALLCTKDRNTEGDPHLTIYLDAVRGGRREYYRYNMQVDLVFEGSVNAAGALPFLKEAQVKDESVKMSGLVRRPLRDGQYVSFVAVLNLKTEPDGCQHAMLTTQDDSGYFTTIEDALVVRGKYYSEGWHELLGTSFFIRPAAGDRLTVKAFDREFELIYVDLDAIQSQLG
ncbi:hypothetical protein FOZ62_032078 [Perkinsus olseni]|uniref:Uncharacterized protein n=1 Tax=Perkinsus olseni TaxID=32597 RepID=A0A7J6RRJ9_PEROL|nr:hypothetical protein FOZ62_032078 [Perkinsus olseni]